MRILDNLNYAFYFEYTSSRCYARIFDVANNAVITERPAYAGYTAMIFGHLWCMMAKCGPFNASQDAVRAVTFSRSTEDIAAVITIQPIGGAAFSLSVAPGIYTDETIGANLLRDLRDLYNAVALDIRKSYDAGTSSSTMCIGPAFPNVVTQPNISSGRSLIAMWMGSISPNTAASVNGYSTMLQYRVKSGSGSATTDCVFPTTDTAIVLNAFFSTSSANGNYGATGLISSGSSTELTWIKAKFVSPGVLTTDGTLSGATSAYQAVGELRWNFFRVVNAYAAARQYVNDSYQEAELYRQLNTVITSSFENVHSHLGSQDSALRDDYRDIMNAIAAVPSSGELQEATTLLNRAIASAVSHGDVNCGALLLATAYHLRKDRGNITAQRLMQRLGLIKYGDSTRLSANDNGPIAQWYDNTNGKGELLPLPTDNEEE